MLTTLLTSTGGATFLSSSEQVPSSSEQALLRGAGSPEIQKKQKNEKTTKINKKNVFLQIYMKIIKINEKTQK